MSNECQRPSTRTGNALYLAITSRVWNGPFKRSICPTKNILDVESYTPIQLQLHAQGVPRLSDHNLKQYFFVIRALQNVSGDLGRDDRIAWDDDPYQHTWSTPSRRTAPIRAATQAQGPQASLAEPTKNVILSVASFDAPSSSQFLFRWEQRFNVLRIFIILQFQTRPFVWELLFFHPFRCFLHRTNLSSKYTWSREPELRFRDSDSMPGQ